MMEKTPRVKTIIEKYKKGDINEVNKYLSEPNMIIDPSTWAGQIKKLIENRQYITAQQMIELIAYKFY